MEALQKASSCYQYGIPVRYVLAILGFFGFVLNYMLRINMSIAMVAIVRRNISGDEGEIEIGEFEWDDQTQSLITGAFFWGYIITHVPGGRLAERFGSKYIFGFSILLSGLVTLLIPLVAEDNPMKIIAVRFVIGILEGATYPAMHALLAKWAPPAERSRITAIVYSGAQGGTVFTLPLVGAVISRWGWRSAFYLMGILPIIWVIFWILFVYETPQSAAISSTELKYLEDSIPNSGATHSTRKVPWRKILTSGPFYAIIAAGFTSNWGFWTLLTLLPTYLATILHFDIKSNALLSSIPYLAMWFFGIAYAVLADHLLMSGILSTKNVRKLSAVLCLGIPAAALCGVGFIGADPIPTLIVFTFAVGLSGAKYSAYLSNHLDIAPNFAGTLLGIANAFDTIPGWLSPLVASLITNNHQRISSWHEVFFISSGMYAFGCLYYLMFASADVQPWNDGHIEEDSGKGKGIHNSKSIQNV